MANKLIRPIKKALAKEYGYKNVSVVNGSGTAWGWVDATITVDKNDTTDSEIIENATTIAREALRKNGLKFYTYGINDTEEFLLNLKHKN